MSEKVFVRPFKGLRQSFKAKSCFNFKKCSSLRGKVPSMDDKGSCSFRHLGAQGCALLSVLPVVQVGGRECMSARGPCIYVCTHLGVA